jgi:hypothetical protein
LQADDVVIKAEPGSRRDVGRIEIIVLIEIIVMKSVDELAQASGWDSRSEIHNNNRNNNNNSDGNTRILSANQRPRSVKAKPPFTVPCVAHQ